MTVSIHTNIHTV